MKSAFCSFSTIELSAAFEFLADCADFFFWEDLNGFKYKRIKPQVY